MANFLNAADEFLNLLEKGEESEKLMSYISPTAMYEGSESVEMPLIDFLKLHRVRESHLVEFSLVAGLLTFA